MPEDDLPVTSLSEPARGLDEELKRLQPTLMLEEAHDTMQPRPGFREEQRRQLLTRHRLAQQARIEGWRMVMASRPASARQAVGLRGGSLRQARYVAEDLHIRLHFEPAASGLPDRVMLHGLLTNSAQDAPSLSGASVEALAGSEVIAHGSLDQGGNFALHEVHAGTYVLRILLPSRRDAVVLDAVAFSNPA